MHRSTRIAGAIRRFTREAKLHLKSASNACQIIRRWAKAGLPRPLIDFINTAQTDE